MPTSRSLDSAKTNHEYTPLPGPNYLRILVLLPSEKPTAPIRCELDTIVLPSRLDYTALSYSWGMHASGDSTHNRRITISGRALLVTQNLFDGLRRLRFESEPRRLWVDAVCINQKDVAERSAQVGRMAEIYAHAWQVAVWLGEDEREGEGEVQAAVLKCFGDEEYDHAVGRHVWEGGDVCALRKMGTRGRLKAVRKLTGDAVSSKITSVRSEVGGEEEGLMGGLVRRGSGRGELEPVVRALEALFQKRYFKRRWILQELYHSRSSRVRIYFGAWNVSFDTFATVCAGSIRDSRSLRRFIASAREDGAQEWKSVQYGLREVERVVRLAKEKEKTTFLEALERSSHLECSDPRDVLFSLASLDPEFGVVPDYNFSAVEVYTSFTTMLVARGMWQTVLDNICSHSAALDERLRDLPSWVPDFQQPFMRSTHIHGEPALPEDSARVVDTTTLSCTLHAIGIVNFGKPWSYLDEAAPSEPGEGFEEWRRRVISSLKLSDLPDVFELDGARPYDTVSMGDVICSTSRVFTTEEAVIVVLTPSDANAETFRIAQAHRRIDLRSLNGEKIAELMHHSALPAEMKFRVSIV